MKKTTFTPTEKVKNSKKIGDTVNVNIKNLIKYVTPTYNIFNHLTSDSEEFERIEVLNLLETVLGPKNTYVENSIKVYKNLIEHLINNNKLKNNSLLYIVSEVTPREISYKVSFFMETFKENFYSDLAQKFFEENRICFDIYMNFNVNVCINMDLKDNKKNFFYLNSKGAFEIDKFLYLQNMKIQNSKFKNIGYNQEFMEKSISTIFSDMKKMLLDVTENEVNINKHLMFLVNKHFLTKGKHYIQMFVRFILTVIIDSSNQAIKNGESDNNFEEKFVNNIKFIKINVSFAHILIETGNVFFKDIFSLKKKKNKKKFEVEKFFTDILSYVVKNVKAKEIKKDNMNIYKDFIIKEVIELKKTKKMTSFFKNIEKNILNTVPSKRIKFNTTILYNILDYVYQLKEVTRFDKRFKKINSSFLKIIKAVIKPFIIEIKSKIGDILLDFMKNKFIIIEGDVLYINEEFYITSNQKHKYPFFGIKEVTLNEMKENLKINNKIKNIFESLYLAYNQPIIAFSGVYKDITPNPKFVNQLQESKFNFCKINFDILLHFINALKYFMTETNDLYENLDFFKYLLPKESDIGMLLYHLEPNYFVVFMNLIKDLNELTYSSFKRKNKTFQMLQEGVLDEQELNRLQELNLKKFMEVINSNKIEILHICDKLYLLCSFYGWYPRYWSDARGRQYPFESVFTITKSPKWRGMIKYITCKDNSQTIEEELKISKNILEINNNKLQVKNKELVISFYELIDKK